MAKKHSLERYKQDSLPIGKPRDDHDRPKGLFLGYEHVVLHVYENSWLEKETCGGDRGLWHGGRPSFNRIASPHPGSVPPATICTSLSSNAICNTCVVDATFWGWLSCPRHVSLCEHFQLNAAEENEA